MSEENFWTIGFQRVKHKRSKGAWVFIKDYNNCRRLKTINREDLKDVIRFQTIEEAEIIIEEFKTLFSDKHFEFSHFTPIYVKNNTKG